MSVRQILGKVGLVGFGFLASCVVGPKNTGDFVVNPRYFLEYTHPKEKPNDDVECRPYYTFEGIEKGKKLLTVTYHMGSLTVYKDLGDNGFIKYSFDDNLLPSKSRACLFISVKGKDHEMICLDGHDIVTSYDNFTKREHCRFLNGSGFGIVSSKFCSSKGLYMNIKRKFDAHYENLHIDAHKASWQNFYTFMNREFEIRNKTNLLPSIHRTVIYFDNGFKIIHGFQNGVELPPFVYSHFIEGKKVKSCVKLLSSAICRSTHFGKAGSFENSKKVCKFIKESSRRKRMENTFNDAIRMLQMGEYYFIWKQIKK